MQKITKQNTENIHSVSVSVLKNTETEFFIIVAYIVTTPIPNTQNFIL